MPKPHINLPIEMEPAALVKRLKEAADAYYNGAPLTMDDDTYDTLLEQLRALDPTNPFLSTIGAPPAGTVVTLPYPMPSLDKIKPGQDALSRFLAKDCPFVLSEKLDGLSAMWIPGKKALYLRGDGIQGQDVSHLVPLGLRGLAAGPPGTAIRGELVVARADVTTLARSWVNGVIHRKDPEPADVAKIRFVAYDVLFPVGLTRNSAFLWLQKQGYEIPWTARLGKVTEEYLANALKARRETSPYDTDGIVVGIDAAPVRPAPGKNPKDAVAFKMPLTDQSAETTVRAVLWGTSAQGYLIPKLEFDPITVGSATIQFCTAHNAKLVESSGLGPGARIVVRRSGDVIPTLDRVISSVKASMPPADTYRWVSDVHIAATGSSPELTKARMHHFLKTLEIPGSGPATAAALVDGGITGPKGLLAATEERLKELLGPKTGAGLYTSVRGALDKASELTLMLASSTMPRAVGETKLRSFLAVRPDPSKWSHAAFGCDAPAGWTASSVANFFEAWPTYLTWRKEELGNLSFPKMEQKVATAAPAATLQTKDAQVICMTGFRDKTLEEDAKAAGHTISPTMTSKVTLLLVPEGPLKESEKTKAARAKGIPILTSAAFVAKYLAH